MDIDLKNCRILYSFGLTRGTHHYMDDAESFYDVCSKEVLDRIPAFGKYIVLVGEFKGFGFGYKRSEVECMDVSKMFFKFLKKYGDEETAKKELLDFYDLTSLEIYPKYKNRYLLKKRKISY